jgi:hypothetical protein
MRYIKGLLIGMLLFSGSLLLLPQQAIGATKDDICDGVALTGGSCTGGGGPSVESVIATVINILSIVVGVIAVIMIIIGGLRYITSGGDSNNTKGAKDTILYAIIGLVVVAMAQVIVRFVLNEV